MLGHSKKTSKLCTKIITHPQKSCQKVLKRNVFTQILIKLHSSSINKMKINFGYFNISEVQSCIKY